MPANRILLLVPLLALLFTEGSAQELFRWKDYSAPRAAADSLRRFDDYNFYKRDSVTCARVIATDKYCLVDRNGRQLSSLYDKHFYFLNYGEGLACVVRDKKYGFIDAAGREAIPLVYDYAENFSNGLACVELDDKCGFLNTAGEVAIPLIYDDADSFRFGLAAVAVGDKYGYIDRAGKVAVPFRYDDAEEFRTKFGRVELDGKYGLVDSDGNETVPCIYDDINNRYQRPFFWAKVRRDYEYGFIDTLGREVVPCIYDKVDYEYGELARVRRGDRWGFVGRDGRDGRDGREKIPCVYDSAESFYNGTALVGRGGKYGYMSRSGRLVLKLRYDNALRLSENSVFFKQHGKWFLVDNRGRRTDRILYDSVRRLGAQFSIVGQPFVYNTQVMRDGKWGILFHDGREALPCIYDALDCFDIEYKIPAQLNGKWGFIDLKTGRVVTEFIYDNINFDWFNRNGFYHVEREGKWGVIDVAEREIVPPVYDSIRICDRDRFEAYLGQKTFYFDRDGNPVATPEYK